MTTAPKGSSDTPVLVAGGGIAGLATALALARRDRPVHVFEAAPAFEEVGAGLQLGPNAVRALDRLGALDRVLPATVAPEAILIRDGRNGRLLARIPLGPEFEARFGAPYRVVHRADLLHGLVETCRATPEIALSTGKALDRFDEDAAGVTASFADGSAAAGRALVGADGIRSAVRRQLLDDGGPDFSGHILYRALAPMKDAPEAASDAAVTLWLGPGGHVVHYPVSAGRKLNIIAAFDGNWHESGWSAPGSPRALLEAFRWAHADLRAVLEAPRRWLKWAGADRAPAERWSRGRVTLVGDAAHAVLPYLAQGAAMALEDAVVLGEAAGETGADLPDAFAAYEAARHARTAKLRSESRRHGRAYHLSGPLRVARDLVVRRMGGARGLDRMAWLYRWP